MIGAPDAASGWIEALWRASWQGGLFIAAVWVFCLAPRLPVRWRCWLWWAACLRLLVGLLELPALPVPVLPAAPAASVETTPRLSASGPAPKSVTSPLAPPVAAPGPIDLLLGLWITGALIRVGAGGRTLLRVHRLRRTARPVEAAGVREEITRLCVDAGVRRPPLMLVSPEARAPMLIGPLSPALLLPVEAIDAYNESELRIALAHELVHLRRGDLWLSAVPGLAQALFFFHPLAWLTAREWAIAREAACDAETLQLTAARPADYGRFLLRLADSGAAPAGALNATPAYRTLERRLKMLRDTASSRPWSACSRPVKLAGVLLVATVAGGFLPWQVTAKEAAAPAVPNSTASAPESGARAPAVKPDPMPAKKDAES